MTGTTESKQPPTQQVGTSALLSADAHAVRWALYKEMGGMEIHYTKWHWTTNTDTTVCGRRINLVNEKTQSVLPQTDDEIEAVNCKHCLKQLGR